MGLAFILGLGISGKAAQALLEKEGWTVRAHNVLPQEAAHFCVEDCDMFVPSPGIDPSHPLYERAVLAKIPLWSEAELALTRIKGPRVAITGSNGKSTVCALTTHILNRCGKKASALGNIGTALSSYVLEENTGICVAELSSFQLQTMKKERWQVPMEAGILLNLKQNHLDRHRDFEEYKNAKMVLKDLVKDFIVPDYTGIEDFRLGNEWAAAWLCQRLGLTQEQIDEGKKGFVPLKHRLQALGQVRDVAYYNDSKSTSAAATLSALKTLSGPLFLIAGGKHKGCDFRILAPYLHKVKAILAIGQAATVLEEQLSPFVSVTSCHTIEKALSFAEKNAIAGDTVLLSPGASSYDQFKNFEERGETFMALVHALRGQQ